MLSAGHTLLSASTHYSQPGTHYSQPGTHCSQPGTHYSQPGTHYSRRHKILIQGTCSRTISKPRNKSPAHYSKFPIWQLYAWDYIVNLIFFHFSGEHVLRSFVHTAVSRVEYISINFLSSCCYWTLYINRYDKQNSFSNSNFT